ncbi:hypothetical protein ACJX0J_008524 [Zea mays]
MVQLAKCIISVASADYYESSKYSQFLYKFDKFMRMPSNMIVRKEALLIKHLKVKNKEMKVKDIHFSNMTNKVPNTNILLNLHILVIFLLIDYDQWAHAPPHFGTHYRSITLLKNLSINGKDMGKSYIDILQEVFYIMECCIFVMHTLPNFYLGSDQVSVCDNNSNYTVSFSLLN